MANFFNIFAGVLAFLGSSALAYGLWTPVMSIFDYFPTALYVMVGSMWVTMLFTAIVWMPFVLMVSDDRGG